MMTVQRYYRPELDVLRFIAFLCVFFVHRMDLAPFDPVKQYWLYNINLVGNFGVPVFFLLSAFLITELLTREQEQTGRVHPKAFYIRRILRIWPLYFVVFFGWVLLTPFFFPAFALPPLAWCSFSLFAGNIYINTHGWLPAYPLNPLWSISVEEQFYILIPLLAAYGGRRGLKMAAYLFLALAYIFLIYYGLHPTKEFNSAWTNSFVQFQFFAVGILLSLYFKGWMPQWSLVTRFLLIVATLGCWLLASIACGIHADAPHLSNVPQTVIGWMLILLGSVLLFLSLLGMPERYLPKPMIYLGRISYGLYVFHISFYWLIYKTFATELTTLSQSLGLEEWRNTLGFVIAFIATVLLSMLSYHFFEKPFLRLKKRFTLVPSRD
ncbi:acyltransferase [Sphingobacterium ginsenosidimutans]|uniref:Acyltransferase 3 domain-containing protein n=1 Tax=Sphingobacterium ginsenosidimutans TaxID=687845 RepID=A0ABP7ZXU1_9SPHI